MERSFWSEQGWEWDVHIENELQDEEEKDNKQGDRHFDLKGNPHDTRNHISIEIEHRLGNGTQSIQEEKVRVLHPVETTGQEREEKEPMGGAENKRKGKKKKNKERKKKKGRLSRDRYKHTAHNHNESSPIDIDEATICRLPLLKARGSLIYDVS